MSRPLTLSEFRNSALAIMRMMVANKGLYIDVSYKGRLYRIHFEDLNTELVKRRRPRHVSLADKVKTEKCPECKKLMLNNVCMNSLCSKNFTGSRDKSLSPR